MDFDDYDSYAPIRPDQPDVTPPPARHRFRAAVIIAGVLALPLVTAPFIGTEEATTVAAEAPVTSAVAPDTRPSTTTTTVVTIPAGDDTTVTRVIDGDTIEVAGGRRIRFIGVDSPETTSSRGCFGPEAAAETRRMLPADQRVRLVYDVDRRDTFGRTLAYVYSLPDGRFVNLALASEGFAVQATVPPNVAHVEELTVAVVEARTAGRGLWGACPAPAVVSSTTTTAPPAIRAAVGTVPTTTVTTPRATGAYYANCTAARAAGAAPLRRGEAGYRSALDRDSDGVACG